MISATAWVPRGYASEFPEKYELDDDEIKRIENMANLNLNEIDVEEVERMAAEEANINRDQNNGDENVKEEGEDAAIESAYNNQNALRDQTDIDNDMKEYEIEEAQFTESTDEGEDVTMFPGLANDNVKYHEGENGEDPYLSLPTETENTEEKQELQVYPSDNMVLATRTEDDVSYLDVYVYDDGAGFHSTEIPQEQGDEIDPDVAKGLVRDSSLYVHHDLMLPAFPLCTEWINYRPGSNDNDNVANFAAIGTFDPQIEIWNLDSVEKAFPDMILGEPTDNSIASLQGQKKKNKKKSKGQHITTHHTDAVLSMAHNKLFRSVLASTSADHTVKLWDLNNGNAVRSLASIHSDKNVSASQWHQTNGSILLTAGYDSRVALSDVRISKESEMSKYWSVSRGEEIETAVFADENIILCGTDSGNVYSFDIRNNAESKPVWTLKAHDSGISTLSVNNFIPGLMSTGAMGEKTVKLWKFPTGEETSNKGPNMVLSRDFDVGNVLTTSFAPDIEISGTMVIGGVNKGLKLWDVFSNRTVRKSFADELQGVQQLAREEAKKLGRSSRIARKYIKNDNPDTVMQIEDQGEDEEERDGEEQNSEED
ncbi:similar to Saccharomyces cerevisiae YLR196W PWP1 Protein with WD-40 repeats involved in rRNA processing [Maudiozyma saulgeensis]|uniref:Similar to Saccharomyces cerevisiae YLR196W PWP1 Protein with WD-40 repeats involved in rRNA processing n=1 Tax=Maudiozyma saulgeensis TaxID=1789683 RepID=A0A1X7R2F4_9SACH|nr:similar to Saccharomyces cerevisiae YLR196W PWP1 Protein with WD-40 repeats involved in rRNA processing [Kazachstania saulgeensis]